MKLPDKKLWDLLEEDIYVDDYGNIQYTKRTLDAMKAADVDTEIMHSCIEVSIFYEEDDSGEDTCEIISWDEVRKEYEQIAQEEVDD